MQSGILRSFGESGTSLLGARLTRTSWDLAKETADPSELPRNSSRSVLILDEVRTIRRRH